MAYQVNKSLGKKVEFKGLQGQYLLYFVGGLFALFFVFLIVRFAGVPDLIALIITIVCGIVLVKKIFDMNRKYGIHGAMKMIARRSLPRFIINRKPIYKIIKTAKK